MNSSPLVIVRSTKRNCGHRTTQKAKTIPLPTAVQRWEWHRHRCFANEGDTLVQRGNCQKHTPWIWIVSPEFTASNTLKVGAPVGGSR